MADSATRPRAAPSLFTTARLSAPRTISSESASRSDAVSEIDGPPASPGSAADPTFVSDSSRKGRSLSPTSRSTKPGAGRVRISRRRAVLQKAAAIHDGDAVAERDRLLHVVRHQDDRHAEPALQREQVLPCLGADDRIERAERFVHQQHGRLRRERPGDADALLLAARKLVRELPQRGGRGRARIGRAAPRPACRSGRRPISAAGERSRCCARPSNAETGRCPESHSRCRACSSSPAYRAGVAALDPDRAAGRLDQPVDHAQAASTCRCPTCRPA